MLLRRQQAEISAPVLALLLALVSMPGLACEGGSASERGFEDDATDDAHPPTPDLPAPSCDPKREAQCPEGQKCSYVDGEELGPTNRCVEIVGEGLAGDSCTRIGETDDCADGLLCWGGEGGVGTCVAFCDYKYECEDEAAVCSVANDGRLPLCLPGCDPLLQDCPEGSGCYPDINKRWACDMDLSGELGSHGDPCECLNCCKPGLICLYAALVDAEGCGEGEAAGCCAQVCTTPDQPPIASLCPSEAEDCEPFYTVDEKLEGFEKVGVCRL